MPRGNPFLKDGKGAQDLCVAGVAQTHGMQAYTHSVCRAAALTLHMYTPGNTYVIHLCMQSVNLSA